LPHLIAHDYLAVPYISNLEDLGKIRAVLTNAAGSRRKAHTHIRLREALLHSLEHRGEVYIVEANTVQHSNILPAQ
jgi:hypothetical protein